MAGLRAGTRPVLPELLQRMISGKRISRLGLFLVAQFAPQDLADRRLGQVGAELDHLGLLVAGQVGRQYSRTCASVRPGSFLTITSFTASPVFSSATPTTAHSSTPSSMDTTSSTSFG